MLVENTGFEIHKTPVQILTATVSCVTWGKLLNHSEPQDIFNVQNGVDTKIYLTGLLGRLNKIMYVKRLL